MTKNEDTERLLVEVEQRVMELYGNDPVAVEQAIYDTLYEEKARLDREKDRKEARRQEAFYRGISRKASTAGQEGQKEALRALTNYYADEVAGHFNILVYLLATQVVPRGLSFMLQSMSPIKLVKSVPYGLGSIHDHVEIVGELEALQELLEKGTIILVSTHSSNMDSIVLGYTINQLGLPPFTYGAGLNLFHNKFLGFFMHNLGAYKVDRRKKAELYKNVLKVYAGCSMEMGYNNMFFPGGTRSRSGAVENRLKMGLLGMGLDAYIHNLKTRSERPDIFVVPCTINYQVVLEAETLIEDYLKETGKSRYIIEDDEFSRPREVLDFINKLVSLDSRITVRIGKSMDVFGNPVDNEGRSFDGRGRVIDRTRYVFRSGEPAFDEQRDHQYTQELMHSISKAFHDNTVVKSTHLLCYTVFTMLQEQNPGMGLYRLLRTGGSSDSMPLPDVYRRMEKNLNTLKKMQKQGKAQLGPTVAGGDLVFIVNEALNHLGNFHSRPAVSRRGDRIYHDQRNLLFYYHNRLVGFDI